MKNFVIPPNSQLELMHEGTMGYFCLAQHYYNNEEYRNFFKQVKAAGHHVLLDNGAGDHALITEDILIWCAKDLMPHEIVPPDFLFDANKTIVALRSFVRRMREEDLFGKIEIFAVPQGNTKKDWLECYELMLASELVHTIGMSKLGIPHAWHGSAKDDQGILEARHECVQYLNNNNLLKKPLHFLGMGDPTEMASYILLDRINNTNFFRSTDSCNSILSGMLGYSWETRNFTRNATPKDYFERTMTEEQITLAKQNIQWFKNLLS